MLTCATGYEIQWFASPSSLHSIRSRYQSLISRRQRMCDKSRNGRPSLREDLVWAALSDQENQANVRITDMMIIINLTGG